MAYYPEGLYECIIRDQGFGESREKRTPCFWLRFLPVKSNGEHIDQQYEREVKLWLTDNTIDQVVARLRAMGWEGHTFKELEPGGSHSFEGTNVQLRCFHSEVNGKVYENWEFPPVTANLENKSTVARKVDALFGKALKGGKGTAVDQEDSPEDHNEIPF